jgi:flagellar motor switch protein FliN/FliY
MSDTDGQVPLPDLNAADVPAIDDVAYSEDEQASRVAADLEAVFDVPVQVSAVLGRSKMDIGELLKLGPGTVLELDRRVGEAIDIYVNNRLVARGEVVLVEDKLGVTMTEIIKAERTSEALLTIRRPTGANRRTGDYHAASHRWHIEGPAHDRHQDRDGQRRVRDACGGP